MAYDKKEMARNLKLCDSIPKEIERQQRIYRDTLAKIRADEATGDYSKNNIEGRKQKALQERNTTCNALARRMKPALDYVAANNNYAESETVNFEDPKLQAALRTLDYMGKDLSPADQASVLASFRGNIGALRVLEKAYRKNGLYMKDAAAELQKPIPQRALSEMAEVLAFQQYAESKGGFDFPLDRAAWTRDAFGKQLEKLGLEDTTTDPYAAVLEAAADKVRADLDAMLQASEADSSVQALEKAKANAQLMKLNLAQREMKDAQARGENPAAVLNRELGKLSARE